MKHYMEVACRKVTVGTAISFVVLGIMAGIAQAQCDVPTPSCSWVRITGNGGSPMMSGTIPPATDVACGGKGARQGWFCDFSGLAFGVAVGGDCFFGFPVPYPDIIQGSDFNDVIDAGEASDSVCGGSGNDVIDGGPGDDDLFGQGDNDVLDGNSGNDSLVGGASDDVLLGGDGFDTLNGGGGFDRCIGGEGVDAASCEVIARSGTAGR